MTLKRRAGLRLEAELDRYTLFFRSAKAISQSHLGELDRIRMAFLILQVSPLMKPCTWPSLTL